MSCNILSDDFFHLTSQILTLVTLYQNIQKANIFVKDCNCRIPQEDLVVCSCVIEDSKGILICFPLTAAECILPSCCTDKANGMS